MRDLVVREALEGLAEQAGASLTQVVSAGSEVPYEVVEEPGSGTALYRYRRLVEPFIRSNYHRIRRLESYGSARAVIEAAGVCAPYLEHRGRELPERPEAILDEALILFFSRVWEDAGDFDPDPRRLEAALAEIEAAQTGTLSEVEVVCPLAGLRLDADRVRVGDVVLSRADDLDVPADARRADGQARAGWEPTVVAWTAVDPEGTEAASAVGLALGRLRRVVTYLRLLGAGSVGLGPHAWTRVGDGDWRRLSTSEPPPRTGTYLLDELRRRELPGLAAALDARPLGSGPVAWAMRRFEAGLERRAPLDGLSDHLLALRGLLEGGGPAELGLSLRVAALCAEPAERGAVKADLDGAIALERQMMAGDADPDHAGSVALAASVESLLRAILRDAATGHLGTDLRATSDEILLADGLAQSFGHADEDEVPRLTRSESAETVHVAVEPDDEDPEEGEDAPARGGLRLPTPPRRPHRVPGAGEDWLGGVAVSGTLDFAVDRRERRERLRAREQEDSHEVAEKVRHLFPDPGTTEWSVPRPPAPVRPRRGEESEVPASEAAPPGTDDPETDPADRPPAGAGRPEADPAVEQEPTRPVPALRIVETPPAVHIDGQRSFEELEDESPATEDPDDPDDWSAPV